MTRTDNRLAAFTNGYAEAMIWANTTAVRNGEPTDDEVYPEMWQTPGAGWQIDAFDADSRVSIESDCRDFFAGNLRDLIAYTAHFAGRAFAWHFFDERAAWEQGGHDFALTRNHHGAGFWDRGMGDLGDRLTDACRPYGESDAYTDMSDDTDNDVHLMGA